jgi:hypothetical protein
MNKTELLTKVAAIVTTLQDTGGSPESMLYLFCDTDLAKWEMLRDILVKADLVKISGHYVTLTENGKITATKLNTIINKPN